MQKSGSHERLFQLLGEFAREFGVVLRVIAGNRLESGIHPVPLFEPDRGNQGYLVRGTALTQLHELVSLREWQGPEKNRVNRGEHGAVRANTEGKRQYDCRGEHRRLCQRACGIAQISQNRLQPAGNIHIARSFHLHREIAKLPPRGSNCLLLAHAARLQCIRSLGNMKRQFAVDVLLNVAGPEDVPKTAIPGHNVSSTHYAKRITRSTPSVSRAQLSCS